MTLQDIINYRKENKGTYVTTTHTMTIAEYKAMALELLTKYKEFHINIDTMVKNRINLTIVK